MIDNDLPPLLEPPPGLYRHYKGNLYRIEQKAPYRKPAVEKGE